jgi:Flp pilus assembly protein TadD
MAKSSPAGASRWLLGLGLLLLVGAGGYVGWQWWKHAQQSGTKPQPDMAKVLALNARGVGQIDRSEWGPAVQTFEEVVKAAPDWAPGKINLGIALINVGNNPNAPNEERQKATKRILDLFRDVLSAEPDNPHANFNMGYLLLQWEGQMAEAEPYFRKVVDKDPNDAFAWYWLGKCQEEKPDLAAESFRRAVQLDPYHSSAIYQLQSALRALGKADEAAKVAREWELLSHRDHLGLANFLRPANVDKFYTERGRYAQVIGWVPPQTPPTAGPMPLFERDERFKVELPDGVRWATAADLGTGPVGDLRRRLRERFGAVVVPLDYDDDGKPDLLLLGAVVEKGQVRDLLLHNEGEGRFRDVTAAAGLAAPRPSLGCCVADFDNDRRPDILITGVGEQHLFRNTGKGFKDVTSAAGLDNVHGVCLGATMVDLDGDSDLDLVLSQYAETPEKALAALDGKTADSGGRLIVFWNVGESKPANKGVDPPPLPTKFERANGPDGLLGPAGAIVNTPFSDVDNDHDIDLIVLADGLAPSIALNDRVGRFRRIDWPEQLLPRVPWNGALVLDVNHHDRSDLLFVGPQQAPVLLLSEPRTGSDDPARWFRRADISSPPLLQAHAVDIDLDGWMDVVGLSRERKPVLLHHDGKKLGFAEGALGADSDWPKDLIGLTVADLDCDGNPDVLLWSERDGLQLRHNRGNGNHGIKIAVSGHRKVSNQGGGPERVNADGLGVRIIVQAQDHWTGTELATLSAGLGQSAQPVLFGLGKHPEADLIRLYWPDGCQQAEFNQPAAPCRVVRIDETNRKQDSCPILFAWNGERFVFVNDFLGAGSVGECEPDGGHRPPRAEESVKIEPEQLAPLDGHFVLKIAEPMSEITYLDRLQLVVLDHPANVRVYPDERFHAGGPAPTQELIAFRDEVFPVKATDHRGRDVTAKLRKWDRDTLDEFARRAWIGFAEEHAVTLDFGDRLSKFGPKDRLFLCLAGWTDYPYPESIWAAHQAGVEMLPPVLERKTADGRWEKVADAGFPAGLPRMMTLEVTGKLGGPSCELRLRTNLHVFLDQAFIAPMIESVSPGQGRGVVRGTALEVKDATLSARGVMKEYSPDGREPTMYDYDRLDAFPVSRLSGRLTRFGDVTELLRAPDDRFVIFGAGDELSVRFDARSLPRLPEGWKRSYVLRTWGYCKDAAPFTAQSETVGPLPFRAMSNYPYRADEKHLDPDYDRKWNTRRVGPRR